MLTLVKKIMPQSLLRALRPAYHFLLALIGALYYRFPSKELVVVGVTGTKGKSSTAEILGNIFEEAGYTTAVLGTIKFKIGNNTERNLKKMTMPGRFFVQKFLRDAVGAGCTHAVVEMTSEGAKQFRQRFIDMDALIFTNLAPEHIESHGSYENYRDAKISIARTLARSCKSHRFMVANTDDKESALFLGVPHVEPVPYSLQDAEGLVADEKHSTFSFHNTKVSSSLGGKFNVWNILGAATAAMKLGVPLASIAGGVEHTTKIDGRMERIEAGQSFPVIVDYAHTPDSLEAIYGAFENFENICVLGNTGGGRDKWKRPAMGALAEKYCAAVILTDEDPYDEDPKQILNEIASGMKVDKPEIILDRRKAIARAISFANEIASKNDAARQVFRKPAVIITGKGTDPFIMGPNGTKLVWDDRVVAMEEIQKLLAGG